MGVSNGLDTDSFFSGSSDLSDNATEVVESVHSLQTDSNLLSFSDKNGLNLGQTRRYELSSFHSSSDQSLKRGTIHAIELHNFKSYFGTVLIDKFASFNAVIGPNGSGKSNLMDAISFVLCIRTSTLRGSNLRDLINKVPDPSDPLDKRFAYVALTLKGDTDFSVFKRVINPNGHISYIYNNNVITFKGYTEALHEYKINTLGSTGLIFQGSVNDIISRTPLELTKLFETISGSALYEKPYDYIKEKVEKMRMDYKNLLLKKKNLNNELKQLKTMDSTNKKYHKILENYNETLVNKNVCQFQILESKFKTSTNKYFSLLNEYKEVVKRYEKTNKLKNEFEEKLANLYYEQGKLNRQIQQKTQILNDMRNSMTDFFSNKISLENKVDSLESVIKSSTDDLADLNSQYDELKRAKRELESEIKSLNEELELSQKDSFTLTMSQMDEFNNYLKDFNSLTSNNKANIKIIQNNINQFTTKLKSVRSRLKGIKTQEDQVVGNLVKYTELIEESESKMRDFRVSLDDLQRNLNGLKLRKEKLEENKVELENKKENFSQKVNSLSVLKSEFNHKFKRSAMNNEMVKSVSGVFGEVLSLFELTNEVYSTAVMASLGYRAHAIVTKDYQTISKCIEFLKQKKAEKRDFISLQRLKSDKSNTRRQVSQLLRRFTKLNYAFAIDLIEPTDSSVGSDLFEYLVGDTVIVDNLDEAERVISLRQNRVEGGNLQFNIVTLKGQMITRNRTIIVGSNFNIKNSEMELELNKYNKYNSLLNEVEKELQFNSDESKKIETELSSGYDKVERYKRNLQILTTKLEYLKKHKETLDLQKREFSNESNKLSTELKGLEDNVNELESKLSRENEQLEKMKAEHFAPLNDKFGVSNVYELAMSRDDKFNKINDSLKGKNVTLTRYQTDLLELERKIEAVNKKLSELKSELTLVKTQLAGLKENNLSSCDGIESVQSEIASLKQTLEGYVTEVNACNEELKKLTNTDDINKFDALQEINLMKEEIHQLYTQSIALTEYCKVHNLPLRFSITPKSQTETINLEEEMERIVLEFPLLSNADEFPKYSNKLTDLESEYNLLTETLGSLQKSLMNLRSYSDLEGKIESTSSELSSLDKEIEEVKVQLVKLESDFEKIRRERSGLFIHCFQAVKENLGPIYGKLSQNEEGAEGQAFLTLDDVTSGSDSEPFNRAIRYNTIPPMKKYLNINLQSGGEKALSSIALLLSLHNYRDSPFVVLDEIDANIDSVKLKNLTKFLMESTFQVIIISLKDKLFSKAQRLIGVYRSHPLCTSKCLVLNLENYPQDDE
ncbi:SMC (structural maintenance of chromosome) protein (type 1), putative [Theileria annulata]|uniref:Structural maintenance of chromosomes protein n=1 Tax=Theileria annulata TaxID=5874 RepID=Q4UGM4_THEAN|nr:SMC (structural maintenance of chromosome) protein (type 1), putative [Theileria annulata]CAI73765.1 SMC (structural maintenance of chromosome) protein (type 1), putative [Theileria annulata]|eukprot:XP_954442.1 SMC (structural maintenance of chromosome) protein (type 1), putative [Theileria annulata]